MYCPVSNVNCIEKVIEDLLHTQLMSYLDSEDIIPKNHHGERPNFSTISAKAHLDCITAEMIEENEIVSTITIDLTSAFDLINHAILIEKLKVIGFSNNACILMSSFLKDRRQFVELQGFCSPVLKIGDWSVLQGSKKSGILYTLFNLEIVFLAILMKERSMYRQITGYLIVDYSEVQHETVNFVDDSTSVAATNDPDVFQQYLNDFHRLIEAIYFINKLKINEKKTQFIIHKHPEMLSNNWKIQLEQQPAMN